MFDVLSSWSINQGSILNVEIVVILLVDEIGEYLLLPRILSLELAMTLFILKRSFPPLL